MNKTTFYIPTMDCPAEEKLIREKLRSVTNIKQLEFNLIQQELIVTHQTSDVSDIQQALTSLGLDIQIKNNSYTNKQLNLLQAHVTAKDWMIITISGLLAFTAEVIAFTTRTENSLLIIVLALASMLVGGRVTFLKGVRAVQYFILNINFLMTIAVLGAVIIGEWPEAAMVTFLFGLAETIESYSLDKARQAIQRLIEIAPDVATVQTEEGSWEVKSVQEIQINDIVWVKPGERIPLDGIVLKGRTSVNQAPITGESIPVEKNKGDIVFAGSINERGSFEFKVTSQTNETLLAKIIRAVQQAQSERAPTQRFVDQFAKYYTPTIVITAILIAFLPTFIWQAPFYPWFYKALVLLVIACPCALVISTPITVVSGLAAAAKHGILIKGGTYLEIGSHLKAIAFDKTGTLTHGKPKATDVISITKNSKYDVLQLAASLEVNSEHPIASAIIQHWQSSNQSSNLLAIHEYETIPGRGLVGIIDGEHYFLGNHRFAEENNVCNTHVESILHRLEQQGKTTIVLGTKHEVLAILAVADTLRETSIQAIQSLHQLGIKIAMITGDNPTTAQAIAGKLSIDDIQANLLPEDKLIAMDELLKKYNKVGMVGDGINDAPALAKATIGFAMGHSGTDVALETADVALMEDNLNKLPFFIHLSRRVWHKLVQNITLSIGIKIIFFALALSGLASLWMAILADMGASLIVVLNGLRLLNFSYIRQDESVHK
ncbi:4-deoxy-4-formamido-L-arabinose-phospho-UDP deformylase [Candidatus Nucleicultrix amoebiphila FS5]|uniref:P-type Zn(2+) transporter n=2 Tax=Candidatus Nucleicultrix TaxID=1509243 RepID=A0A1W6N4K0_9PROT|nr:4-deoxy-4-formamido-L-arabinose-phospho-UDP deformylase [Candidatus Nucleicultrix amoebiphila FS5]